MLKTMTYVVLHNVIVERWCEMTGDTHEALGLLRLCTQVSDMFMGVEVGNNPDWTATFVVVDRAVNVLDAVRDDPRTLPVHALVLQGAIEELNKFVEVPVLVHSDMVFGTVYRKQEEERQCQRTLRNCASC